MRGLIAARTAVMTAVAAIDADMRRMTRASAACRRLMTIPGVGQLTALAFVAAIDDPSRIRLSETSAPIWVWFPGGISRARSTTPAASRNAGTGACEPSCTRPPMSMLTRYKGELELKDWAFAIARRSTMRKREVVWLAASGSSCMRCCETRQSSYWPKPAARDRSPNPAPKGSDAQGREQTTARIL